jgi:hypothetical protein
MNRPRRFLFFIPVETQHSRRTVVIGYYSVFLAFAVLFLWTRGPARASLLLPVAYAWAALLGGLTTGGPVRLFSKWQRKFKDGSAWGIDGNRPHPWLPGRTMIAPIDRLDEHDLATRDRAHYLAYSTLRWPAIVAALFSPLFLLDASPEKIARVLLLVSIAVAALFFSLPQAIVLWTEPDLDPDPEERGTQTVVKVIP